MASAIGIQDAATESLATEKGEEEHHDQDQQAVLAEDGPELPRRLARHEREQDRPAVERWDGHEIEQPRG